MPLNKKLHLDLPISGPRLMLRDWQSSDLESYAHWLKPHHLWHDFNGPYFPRSTEEEIPAIIERHQKFIDRGTWPEPRSRMVIASLGNDELVGTVNSYWECEQTKWLSIGVAIHDEANWSKGFGYEALEIWCNYLFAAHPEIVRLGFATWSGNVGMLRLAEKLGFKEEARHRKARIVKGEYYDSMGYGILREEWDARE